VTILLGDPGVGKSALLDSLVTRVRAQGIPVLVGRAPAADDPPPFSLIRAALAFAAKGPGASSGPSFPADAALDRSERAAEEELTADDGRAGFEYRLLKAVGISDDGAEVPRERVFQRITDRVLEYAGAGPLVLVFDDLHRADTLSLAALEYLVTHLRARPVWVLVSSRTFASLTESRLSVLERFRTATGATEILLRPMTVGDVRTFLEVLEPGRKFTPLEVDRIFTESRGNPLLVQLATRRLASSRVVRDRGAPELSPLSKDAAQVLGVAAVLGPSFDFDLLQGASGLDKARLAEVVDHLVERRLLFERPDDLFEFPQDRLRELEYGRLSETQVRAIHLRAGRTREVTENPDSTRVFSLARDFYIAKDDRNSLKYNRIAAEIAERASAPDIARSFLARALENQRHLDPADLEAEALQVLELARVTLRVGRLKEAESMVRGFLDRAKDDPSLSTRLRASNEILLAQALTAQGSLLDSARIIGRVLRAEGLSSEPLLLIGAHHELGLILYYQGRYTDALAEHSEELRLAQQALDDRLTAHARKWRAGDLMMLGKVPEALSEAREVARELDRLGSVDESAQGHLFYGNMLADDKSNPDHRREAIEELGKAIRFGEEAHDPRRVGWAHYFTAEVLLQENRRADALRNADRAYDVLGRIGDRVGQSVAAKVRGQIALADGSLDLGEQSLREAERLLEGSEHKLEEIDVGLRIAQLYVLRGDRSRARAKVTELERRGLPTARPDLAPEFELVKASIGTAETPSR
jgi:tetratricopeptide (TPR) repeat protein